MYMYVGCKRIQIYCISYQKKKKKKKKNPVIPFGGGGPVPFLAKAIWEGPPVRPLGRGGGGSVAILAQDSVMPLRSALSCRYVAGP
mmetsp:Transcript_17784/g.14418  ORF Transcript_17784/g.14418 Transcript_17784/m.14418 type:complete len:86 (-) Transcript_17784:14-271(-)